MCVCAHVLFGTLFPFISLASKGTKRSTPLLEGGSLGLKGNHKEHVVFFSFSFSFFFFPWFKQTPKQTFLL